MMVFGCSVVIAINIVFMLLYLYSKIVYNYWKRRGIPLTDEPRFPLGSIPNPFLQFKNVGVHGKNYYDNLKSRGLKHGGIYLVLSPTYLAIDLDYIKDILQRNFNSFKERGFYYNEKDDLLSANLFAIGGDKWKTIRHKLSPAFTVAKLKGIFENLLMCGDELENVANHCFENDLPLDMKEASACFTTDVIGSCGFGVECSSLKNPDSEFRKHGKKIFEFTSLLRCIKVLLAFGFPNFSRFMGVTLFDRGSRKFFETAVRDTVEYRISRNIVRNDVLQLLLEYKSITQLEHVTKEVIQELVPQVFIFFAAGFETSSITLSCCLYELAQNPDVQKKLKNEINLVLDRYNGQITYDAVMEMKYLGQVIQETLRKYPPVSYISRLCGNNCTISGTNSVIEKGTTVLISILGLHHDPEYYPDPEKFEPERFSDENYMKRDPTTYMPFGGGPRICIGMRFGLMQTKIGVVHLLKNHCFSLNEKTKIPLEIEPMSFTLMPKTDILLDIRKSR